MNKPPIDAHKVTKSFAAKTTPAVQSISISIQPGEVTGLVGPDGAGKTTFLRLLAGLLLPDEGSIKVFGQDTRNVGSALRNNVAYMPQRFGLYEDLSVQENLSLYADLRGLKPSRRKERFETLLAFTSLAPFTRRSAGKLSGGMKQKLGLACALIRTPKVLLLDEPSVGVDPISRKELWELTNKLTDQGLAIIWSSAYLDEAERCSSVLLLSDGEQKFLGPPQALTQTVSGRTFIVKNIGENRRKTLATILKEPDVMDGNINGRHIRFLVKPGLSKVPSSIASAAGADATVRSTTPRFEDAFVALLGGGGTKESPFARSAPKSHNQGTVAIDASNLTRKFGDFIAADNVSFKVRRGRVFGLIGPNGAGKSTTFKMLCGLLKPSSGSATVAGIDLRKAPSRARARIGYMAQKFSLYGDLSVRQNLIFFAGLYGLKATERKHALNRVIDIFSFGAHLNSQSKDLSLGYQRRLALACSVMHDPDILFLDEPTSGVDPRARREFWGHINAMVGRGVTIIVTTHFLDEAEYCDDIALINRGKIIASGEPDALKDQVKSAQLSNPTLEDAFVSIVQASKHERGL